MIDGLGSSTPSESIVELEDNLAFTQPVDTNTGEVLSEFRKGQYECFDFTIFPGRNNAKFQGSIHKFASFGMNVDDFTYLDIVDAIMYLCDEFNWNPHNCRLRHIEFCVCLRNVCPRLIISSLLFSKGKLAEPMKSEKGESVGIEFRFSQYRLKIYDRAHLHFIKTGEVIEPTLAIELHFEKMEIINKLGIYTLADLMVRENYIEVGKLLKKHWDQIVFDEPVIDMKQLSDGNQSLLNRWKNPRYIQNMFRNNKVKYYKELRLREKVLAEQNDSLLKPLLSEAIAEKWNFLMKGDLECTGII